MYNNEVWEIMQEQEIKKADLEKNLQTDGESCILDNVCPVGAASGALDGDSPEGEAHAELYYESIRNRVSDSDVEKIARNINFPEKVVKDIKNHIFLDEHDFGQGLVGRFDPDYHIAQAWQRLETGKHTELDIMFLKHELVELTQMKKHGYIYKDAHIIANRFHNWECEIIKQKKKGA